MIPGKRTPIIAPTWPTRPKITFQDVTLCYVESIERMAAVKTFPCVVLDE
jgi:hypothetical protein